MTKLNKKLKISIIVAILLLMSGYISLMFLVKPNEYTFILSHNAEDSEIRIGETINVNVSLKNKSCLSYFAYHGIDLITIAFKPDNGEEVAILPVAQPTIFTIGESYKSSRIIEPTETGNYEIVIIAAFSIRGKQYYYTDTVKITVVE